MSVVAIHYSRQYFGETTTLVPASSAQSGKPRGLMGRQVANAEMLSALLKYSSDESLSFLVDSEKDAEHLRGLLKQQLPAEKKAVISRMASLETWMAQERRHVIWEPQPPAAALAWTRSRVAPNRFAVGGVTHTLCSASAAAGIRDLVAAPTRNFDRLVCTSDSVAHTARTLIQHWARIVGKDHDPERIALDIIPLGIDCDRHRPASTAERTEVRRRLNIPQDADVVLFVGRLSHHAKSNPLPMFIACQRAANRTGRPVYLLLAGWYANDAIRQGFESEAQRVAPDVTLLHVNAMDDSWRDSVWAAADLFISLADSVQETFGLTVVEAMARRLAVVATDFNGYRETIQHRRTGILVPTAMVAGAGEDALIAMHEGRLTYDRFLAAVGQTVCVSTVDACNAVEELLCSAQTREQLAEAAFRHARAHYQWPRIIARYERMWREQNSLMIQQTATTQRPSSTRAARPAIQRCVPTFRELFDRYPSIWVERNGQVISGQQRFGDAKAVTESTLAGHSGSWRHELDKLEDMIDRVDAEKSGQSVHELLLADEYAESSCAHATKTLESVAWALKFDLLQLHPAPKIITDSSADHQDDEATEMTFTTTCMGRLHQLKQTLPKMVAQPGCHVVVVDYSCPDQCGAWIRRNFSPEDVTVVHMPGKQFFDRSEAKNAAILAAKTPWVCLIDADVELAANFSEQIRYRLVPDCYFRCLSREEGVGGTFIAAREALLKVGLHDCVYSGWGEEDFDLIDALRFIGQQPRTYPEELVTHLAHDDDLRTQHHQTSDRRVSHMINRVYRAIKWDSARLRDELPDLESRKRTYEQVRQQVLQAVEERKSTRIVVPMGKRRWAKLSADGARELCYRIDIDPDF